ncbi:MAG: ABC transporter transmembrane domain-containing protein [Alistipes onderdonkii]
MLIIPILTRSSTRAAPWNGCGKPAFEPNMDYLRELINFLLYRLFGENYSGMEVLIFLGLFIITSSLLSNLFRYLGQRTIETMRIRTLERLRNKVYDNVTGMHTGYFSNERKGDIISKISSDVQVVQFCITNTLQVAFRDPFLIIGYMVALVLISWKLTIFSALPAAGGAGHRLDRQRYAARPPKRRNVSPTS